MEGKKEICMQEACRKLLEFVVLRVAKAFPPLSSPSHSHFLGQLPGVCVSSVILPYLLDWGFGRLGGREGGRGGALPMALTAERKT